MADAPARVGRYEIIDLVGQGGMGRVYRARDTQLARTVAVKVLPEAFAADSDYLRRFEQEARATAALSHPGVLSIYDVGTHAGAPYLVSELLEGTTLRARLTSGKLPIDKALDFGVQAAHALAAAHARGIVHRDLKPENLFVSPADRITILDFGLAKLTPTATADQTFIDVTGTLGNAIIGTPSYMAPEQARGEKVDHRADIFSLGCILYEMLNGRRAFDGNTPADVLSAILRDTPPHLTSSVEQPTSPAVDRLVQRCLAKDPNLRFQSASDLAFALENVGNAEAVPVQAGHRVDRRPSIGWKTAALVLAAIAAVTVAAVAAILLRRPAPVPDIVEFHVPAPANESFAPMPLQGLLPTAPQVGLSPDGRLLAFVTVDSGGRRRLWIRSLDDSRARAVDGADGATSWPFWSPDSRHVVVAAGRALLKVDTGKDTVERLTTLPDTAPPVPFVTGTWNEAGTILFSVGGRTGIYRTDASGSAPQLVTTIDDARGDDYHSWPQFLPDGRFLVFVRTAKADTNGTYRGSLDSKELRAVQSNPSRAIYAGGQLLWAIEDKLVAQPFDASALRLSGEPVTLVPSIFQGAGRTPGFWVSDGGDLVFAPGDTRERQFRWHSRAGNALETVGPPGLYVTFDLSSDVSSVVVEVSKDITARRSTLAMVDTARGALTPFTVGDQNDSDPRFDDHGGVLFARNSTGAPGIVRVDQGSKLQSMVFPRGTLPVLWLEDATGSSDVIYRSGANRDAWQLVRGAGDPQRLTNAKEPIEQVQMSPDRRWIAYNTAESGRAEVFVSSVPFGGERWQVSVDGGVQPTWRGDGRELYFLGLDGGLYGVEIGAGTGALKVGTPALLFRTGLPVISSVVEQYRPTADGQRFLFCLPLTAVRSEPLRMILNWPTKVTQR